MLRRALDCSRPGFRLSFVTCNVVFLSRCLSCPSTKGEGVEAAVPIKSRALEHYKLIEPFLQGVRTMASIAGQADINLRRAQRWVNLYRRNGLEALAQQQRVDRGTKRAMSQRMVQTTEGLALERPRVPISAICRELKEFAAETANGSLAIQLSIAWRRRSPSA